ncbi:MAG: helix-turn-helix domain-containing protein [Chloroflexota bacterium]|nr:helix-turn-helix domain-containing protein [Chloroflexota bacterium]
MFDNGTRVGYCDSTGQADALGSPSNDRRLRTVTLRRRPYFSRQDALELAGVTSRQESYWRKQGLFQQDDLRRYFETDVEQLKMLKRLIVDLGMPIDTVKQLLGGRPYPDAVVRWNRLNGYRYIDTEKMAFVKSDATLAAVLADLVSQISDVTAERAEAERAEALVDEWLHRLMLLRFLQFRRDDQTPEVYRARRERLITSLQHMDLVARADFDIETAPGEELVGMSPPLPDDPEFSGQELEQLSLERYTRLNERIGLPLLPGS